MPVYNRNLPVYSSSPFEQMYALRFDQAYELMTKLLKGDLGDFLTDLKQNSEDYIVSVTWYPFNMSSFGTFTSKNLTLGKETFTDLKYKGFKMTPSVKIAEIPSLVRKHHNFLDFAPYTNISLQVPFFEKFIIDPRDLYGHKIEVYMSVDFSQNQASCYLYRDGYELLDTRTSVIGIDIPLGKTNEAEQKRNNVLQTISAIGSVAAVGVGAATGNPLISAGGVALISKNVTTGLQNNVDRLTGFKGSNGGRNFLSVDREIRLLIEYPYNVRYPSRDLKGKVLNQTRTLNTLRGYTEVELVHFNPFDTLITSEEVNEIVDLLKAGIEL